MTLNKLCCLCDVVLTLKSDSAEHVIINAVGGRRTVSGVLCVACNSSTGETWDAALAKQLNQLGLFFHIKRERGTPASEVWTTASGERVRVSHTGMTPADPTFVETPNAEGGVRISFTTRTMAETRNIVLGLKRKYPDIDVDAVLSQAELSQSYIDEPFMLSLSVGGAEAGRSIVKSTLVLAVANGASAATCADAKRYLTTGKSPCFGYYYETDLVRNRPARTPLHCVAVKSTETGLLLGYVEFFGVFRMVVCLSSDFSGDPVNACVSIDPTSGSELELDVDLDFSRADIAEIYDYKRIPEGTMEAALEAVLPVGVEGSWSRARKAAAEQAVQKAWSELDLPHGEILTQQHLNRLSSAIGARIGPFVEHFLRNYPREDRST